MWILVFAYILAKYTVLQLSAFHLHRCYHLIEFIFISYFNQHYVFIVVVQSLPCPTVCDPMGCSMPGFPVLHTSQSLLKLTSIEWVMQPNHLILCHPLLLPLSIFPNIRVFSNESALRIRWWKYLLKLHHHLSSEYSGLTSFKIDRFDLLAV